MKPLIKFFLLGILFGIVLIKSEVVSWYRIQEMFRFQSFHMYGVLGSGVLTAGLSLFLIRRFKARTLSGDRILLPPHPPVTRAQLIGGTIFGFGWALTGACPGPMFAMLGSGYTWFIVVLLSAVAGTWTYGALRSGSPRFQQWSSARLRFRKA